MLGRFLDLFRGRPVLVKGAGKLPEGMAKKVDVGDPLADGKQVVLCRVKGRLHALDARCPHAGGRLAEGPLVEGTLALCPLHNFHFDVSSGRAVRGACPPAKTYRVREHDGDADLWA